jgi:CRP-like cAMP-binding protein
VLNLSLKEYNPDDTIIKKDDIGSSMFFVISGVVQVISEDGKTVFAKMGGNTFFGEVALFFDVPRTATVRARDKCVLFELEKSSVRDILKQYPKIEKNIVLIAENNYKLFKKRQESVKKVAANNQNVNTEAFEIEVTANRFRQVSSIPLSV